MSRWSWLGVVSVLSLGLTGCFVHRYDPGPPPRAPRTAPMGATERVHRCPHVRGNGGEIVLAAGTYRCKLEIKGNGNVVRGAGPGRTFLDGKLEVKGNGNRVVGLTVLRKTELKGHDNRLSHVDTRGGVEVKGRGHGKGRGKGHGRGHGRGHPHGD